MRRRKQREVSTPLARCLTAASRAVETDEVNALVRDPLAVLLAGKQALARATDRAKVLIVIFLPFILKDFFVGTAYM